MNLDILIQLNPLDSLQLALGIFYQFEHVTTNQKGSLTFEHVTTNEKGSLAFLLSSMPTS